MNDFAEAFRLCKLSLNMMNDTTFLSSISNIDLSLRRVTVKPGFWKTLVVLIKDNYIISNLGTFLARLKILWIERFAEVSATKLKAYLMNHIYGSYIDFKNILYYAKNYIQKGDPWHKNIKRYRIQKYYERKAKKHYLYTTALHSGINDTFVDEVTISQPIPEPEPQIQYSDEDDFEDHDLENTDQQSDDGYEAYEALESELYSYGISDERIEEIKNEMAVMKAKWRKESIFELATSGTLNDTPCTTITGIYATLNQYESLHVGNSISSNETGHPVVSIEAFPTSDEHQDGQTYD